MSFKRAKLKMEETSAEMPSVCRGCLSAGCRMVKVTLYKDMFRDLTGIDISPSDGLPQTLCYECLAMLQKSVRFRSKVIKSYNLLCQYVHMSLPVPYKKNSRPHLSRSRIVYCEVPDAQVKQPDVQHNAQPDNIGMPVITKVDTLDIKEEKEELLHDFEDDIAAEKICKDAYKITSQSEELREKCEIKYLTERQETVNSIVDKTSVPDITIKTERVDVKVEPASSEDEDNITIEEYGWLDRERTGFSTQGKGVADNTTSEVKPEEIAVKCEKTEPSSNEPSEILAPCGKIKYKNKATKTPRKARTRRVKRTIKKVKSSTRKPRQSYICDTCNRCFKRKVGLIEHLRVHAGDKPYKCFVCMRWFTLKSSLIKHERIHTGDNDKSFECCVCMKYFDNKAKLIRHYRIHT